MPEFDALGRDVAAAADSSLDPAVARAVKALWVNAGYDQGDNPNHLWNVAYNADGEGFALTAALKDANVYVPLPYHSPPSTAEELAVAAPVAEDAPVEVPAEEAPTEEAPAEAPAEEPVAEEATPLEPAA